MLLAYGGARARARASYTVVMVRRGYTSRTLRANDEIIKLNNN